MTLNNTNYFRKIVIPILLAQSIPLAFAVPASVDIVAPNNLASVEGNSGDAYPFVSDGNTVRYQEVFDASQFSTLSGGGGIVTGLVLRRNGVNPPINTTITNLQINLSTTTRAPNNLSVVFSQNIGLNEMVVFPNGPFHVFSGESGVPRLFVIEISFSTGFFYNPSAGNLLMDVRNFSGEDSFGLLDGQDTLGDSISRVYAASTIPNNGVNALSGTADSLGLVVDFEVTPVPEPSTWALLVLGGLGMGIASWRKKSRQGGKA